MPKPDTLKETKAEQLNLFEEKLLTKKAVQEYKLIGQVFDTYWLVEFQEQLYIIDQHAAHERVVYKKTLHGMKDRTFTSQYLSPADYFKPFYAGGSVIDRTYGTVYKNRF